MKSFRDLVGFSVRSAVSLLGIGVLVWPLSLQAGPAAESPLALTVAPSIVLVICGDRQGSGAYLAGGSGYVLTAGHVVRSPSSGVAAESCSVGFSRGPSWEPKSYYDAEVALTVFDDRSDTDFAFLKLGPRLSGPDAMPREGLSVSEGLSVGDDVTFFGFPSGGDLSMQTVSGRATSFRRGAVRTDAKIAQGYSGGPVVDAAGNLVGIASRLIYRIDPDTGAETVDAYEAVDVLSMENWLDAFGGGHDNYVRHADGSLAHGPTPLYRVEEPPCNYLVRTVSNPAVYCLLSGMKRMGFPSLATYSSWYANFDEVLHVYDEDLAKYRLAANMTMKAGSLIKIQTDPRVYFVADNLGTIRWVTSEAVAERLAGPDWASQVSDVADSFFINYRIAEPIL